MKNNLLLSSLLSMVFFFAFSFGIKAQDANAGNDITICTNSYTLYATQPNDGTGIWTRTSGEGEITNPQNRASTVTNLGQGENVFRWTVTFNGQTAYDEITITNMQVTADAGADIIVCDDMATLNAVSPGTNKGEWTALYNSATINSPQNNTTTLENLGLYTNTFQWKVSNSHCSATDEVQVNKNIVTTNAGIDDEICSLTTIMTATAPKSFEQGLWTIEKGNCTFVNSALHNTEINSIQLGYNEYRWTVKGNGCSASDVVAIVNNYVEANTTNSQQRICTESSTLIAVETSTGTGIWLSESSEPIIESSLNHISRVTNLVKGKNVFRWNVSLGNCSAFSEVAIYNDLPSIAITEDDKSVCSSESSLTADEPIVGSGLWTAISSNATIQSPNNHTTLVNNLSPGANLFKWTVKNNDCQTSKDITIHNNKITVTAGSDHATCLTHTQITASNAYPGYWTTSSNSAVISDISASTTDVVSLSKGLNAFRWKASHNGCTASAETRVMNNIPSPANILTESHETCLNYDEIMAENPEKGDGYWELVEGSATIVHPSSYRTEIIDMKRGTNTFKWIVAYNGCTETAQISITNKMTEAKILTKELEVCKTSTTIKAENLEVGTGKWTITSGVASIANEYTPETTVNGMIKGIYRIKWVVNHNNCSSYDEMLITNNKPTVAQVQEDIVTCDNKVIVVGNAPSSGTGKWSTISGGGDINSPNDAQTYIYNLKSGSSKFRWTISFSDCSYIDELLVTSNHVSAYAGENAEICGTTYTMNALSTNTNAIKGWSLEEGSGNITNPQLANTTITELGVGANTFRWSVKDGDCSSSEQVIITNNKYTPYAGNNFETCNDNVVLNATDIPYIGGVWSVVKGNATIENKSISNPDVKNLSRGVNTFRWNYFMQGCHTYDDVDVLSNAVEAFAGNDKIICQGATTQLEGNAPTNGNGKWTTFSGNVKFSDDKLHNTQITEIGSGSNFLVWTITESLCSGSDIVNISNNEFHLLGNKQEEICITEHQLQAATLPIGATGLWQTINSDAVIETPTSTYTKISNIRPGEHIFKWTVTKSGCSDSQKTTITNKALIADAGENQIRCSSTTTLNATLTEEMINAGAEGRWEVTSGGAQFDTSSDYNGSANRNPKAIVSRLKKGDNSFRWTLTVGTCVDYDEIIISNNEVTADAGRSQYICETYTTLNANTPVENATGQWFTINNTDIVFVDKSKANSRISGITKGTTTLKWHVEGNGCTASSLVDITNSSFNTSAGKNQLITADTTHMDASIDNNQYGEWTTIQGSATLLKEQANAFLTNISPGINIFRWSVTNNICTDVDDVVIIFEDGRATVERKVIYTCDDSVQVRAYLPKSGKYGWEFVSGEYKIRNNDKTATWLYDIVPGRHVIKWFLIQNGHRTEDSTIIHHSQGVNAGDDFIACEINATFADAEAAKRPSDVSGIGVWEILSGSALIQDKTNNKAKIVRLTEGEKNIALWTVTRKPCSTCRTCINRDTVEFTYRKPPFAKFDLVQPTERYPLASVTVINKTDPNLKEYEWDYGDGTKVKGYAPLPHKYKAWGNKPYWHLPLKLTVSNEYCSDDSVMQVMVKQPPPFVNKNLYYSGCVPLDVTFNNSDIISSSSVRWEFGDGAFLSTENPTHTYTQTGIYTANIFAKDEVTGETLFVSHAIIDAIGIPEIDFTFDAVIENGFPELQFRNTSLFGGIYTWEFGDETGNTSTDEHPTHSFPSVDEFVIKITALNECGINEYSRNIIASSINNEQQSDFKMYPNPSNDLVVIETADKSSRKKQLQLFSLDGKLVMQKEFNTNTIYLHTSMLKPSVYIVSINSGTTVVRKRLLVLSK